MVTLTALLHPTIQDKILDAVVEAQSNMHGDRGTAYVANRDGNNIMRMDVFGDGRVVVYGRESRVITETVERALGVQFCAIV